MPRYVALLRGVSPVNARMPDLKRCFESAGFQDVRTVLSSGNVVFSSRASSEVTLARKAETAMQAMLGRKFATIVKSATFLQDLVESRPAREIRPAKRCETGGHVPARHARVQGGTAN